MSMFVMASNKYIKQIGDQKMDLCDKQDPEEKDHQGSQGVLIEQTDRLRFGTIEEKIEELRVNEIVHFNLVPDYQRATGSLHPFVTKTSVGYFCLDGWPLIEMAKVENRNSLTCHVDYIEGHSEEELAIRKVALRVLPRGGTGSYAETVRNTRYLEQVLLASDKDLRVFHHGGDRRGEGFTSNKQDNVVKVLSHRLGKSVTTINQYLNHSLFLNGEILNFLADQEVRKDFFERTQPNKRVEITRMMSERLSDAEIANRISEEILEWHKEYQDDGKIRPVWNGENPDAEDEEDNHVEAPQETVVREVKQEIFNPWCGSEGIDEEDSFEKVRQDTEDLAKKLLEVVSLADPNRFYERIMEETSHFYLISKRAAQFRRIQNEN